MFRPGAAEEARTCEMINVIVEPSGPWQHHTGWQTSGRGKDTPDGRRPDAGKPHRMADSRTRQHHTGWQPARCGNTTPDGRQPDVVKPHRMADSRTQQHHTGWQTAGRGKATPDGRQPDAAKPHRMADSQTRQSHTGWQTVGGGTLKASLSGTLPSNSAGSGYATEGVQPSPSALLLLQPNPYSSPSICLHKSPLLYVVSLVRPSGKVLD